MVEEEMKPQVWTTSHENRRSFIGGSDALVIMGRNEAALIQLWREKRGEAEAEDCRPSAVVGQNELIA
jgi:predicted phage-related endonuclease